ncbi:MAG: hypothetical protein HOM14_15395 [Gammaproteobacteria bacterium]|jgi:hypothetical protein|nr:hypothetical protein [Gammaproteobacteria bacterium]MBT3723271.1 hypothetical protein [Gammaproteobacteria bacterium]MBT4076172.1 hypothetical protein [Gammaproteobacteria bacterium]MBT4194773.1 hypothetical protein [Gammaproteobacteria bacterium]MBT4452306.1 hypothetical protein [Gammaproteobacteria bacterium]
MTDTYHPAKKFNHAELLYKILPTLYRDRDKQQDLKKYLNASGLLLDQIHQTLLQRYADIFPDTDKAYDIDSQKWLLPYLAALLDVHVASPLEKGQRLEIANAISWRKAKGTVQVVEQMAESIGDMEVVVHEAWKRVATTARLGLPLLPLEAYGYTGNESYSNKFLPSSGSDKPDIAPIWARHPGLPAGTVDLRCQGSAAAAKTNNPAANISHIAGKKYRWRQTSLHGAQSCNPGHSVMPFKTLKPDWIPGYFDDPSVRTIDFRNPNWRQGHFHPSRVLLFTATHPGFFTQVPASRRFLWNEDLIQNESFLNIVNVEINGDTTIFHNKSLDNDQFQAIIIRQRVKLGQVPSGTGPVDPSVWRFEGFIFSHTIEADSGRLELERCAVLAAEVHSTDLDLPVITANDCLFKRVQAAKGLVQLQYCTVLNITLAENLLASGCIFNGLIRKDHDDVTQPGNGCIRYSSILPEQAAGKLQLFNHVIKQAVFFSTIFGESGCAVLHPATSKQIKHGAQDGAEAGAYHHLYLQARGEAVIKKLKDFLPTGMQAVIIPDASLHHLPGEITETIDAEL